MTAQAPLSPKQHALLSLSLSMVLSSLGTSIANVALPSVATAFDASFGSVQWVVLAYLLASTTLLVSVGRLGDLIGRRRLLLAGISLFTIASLFCAAAPTLGLLILARGAQGIGSAIMMTLSMALVGEAVPHVKTGRAMGLLGTMSAIGTALGPSLGGGLIEGFGWRAVFAVLTPIGLLTLLLALRALPVDRDQPGVVRPSFDRSGTLLLALTLAAYALATTMGRTGPGGIGTLNLVLLLICLGAAALFVRAESRATSPLIRFALFRDAKLSASLAMGVLVSTVMMATLVVGPFYLSGALGLDAGLVGLVLSIGPFVAGVTGVPAGRFSDRFGVARATAAGLTGMVTGCLILSIMPTAAGVCGYIAPMVVITVGYALFQTANNTSVMANVASEKRGVIAGLLNLSRNLGLITGASVMGAIFARASTRGLPGGMHVTYATAAGLLLCALLIAFVTRSAIPIGQRLQAESP